MQAVNQIKGKCAEYQKPRYFAFMDCKIVFNSVETKVFLAFLEQQGIEKRYNDTLAEIQN